LAPVRRNGQVSRGESGGSGLPFDAQPLWSPSNFGKLLYGICNLSLDKMSSVDQQRKYSNCGNQSLAAFLIASNYPHVSSIFFPTVYFIADVIPHFYQCTVSHTLSLCLSAVLLSTCTNCFDIKTLLCIFSISINKCIMYRTVLISKVAPT
jgi:hypothetical protein